MAGPCKCPHCNASDICDDCAEVIPVKDPTYEVGNKYVCRSCYEKLIDQAEAIKDGER
jgi:hypothetical protein